MGSISENELKVYATMWMKQNIVQEQRGNFSGK